jgi:F420-non-reducing hydrogenase small subunit
MSKPKIAVSWNSSCGGCDESIVDIEEKILDIAGKVEFVLWPCAMDFKYKDIENLSDGEITVSLINGAVQNSDQEHIVKLLRKKSRIVVAFGSCACLGGIPSLANLTTSAKIIVRSFFKSPTVYNEEDIVPITEHKEGQYSLTLPGMHKTVSTLDMVIEVDYYLPGCPPTAGMVAGALNAILEGKLPEKGSVLAPEKALCASCNRNESKPETIELKEIKRIHEVIADPELCFLAQGILCLGPATRDGCDYPCIKGNMPCTGCMGPVPGADQGAKMIGTLGGILGTENEKKTDSLLSTIVDPAGTFYRYSTGASLLGRKREKDD